MVEFHDISEMEWEHMPSPKPPKPPNPWDELLGAVEAGRIVMIDVPQEKLRGVRIGIARTASARHGMKVDFRYEDGHLAIRRSEKSVTPLATTIATEATEATGRRHRKRSNESEG